MISSSCTSKVCCVESTGISPSLRCAAHLCPQLSARSLRLVQLCFQFPQKLSLNSDLFLQRSVFTLQLSQGFLRVSRLHLHRLGHILQIKDTHVMQIDSSVQLQG